MEHWLESNKIFEASQLNDVSQKVVEFLAKSNLQQMYEFYIDCMNIDHVDFVIKSHYMLGQISTILDHIKVGDAYFGVNNGGILFECMFIQVGNEFKMYKITDEGFNNIEQQIANM